MVFAQRTKGVRKGKGVEVTFTKQVSTPVIHILYIWIVITHVVSSYAKFLEQNIFLYKKRVQSPQAAFLIFSYTNMAALTSYEAALWFKYSSLPLYCKKSIKNQQMSENYDLGIGVCTMKDQHFLSPLCCFVFYTT